jgi:hypothetical protein
MDEELLERGFSDGRIWDWRNFEPGEVVPNIYLYKLHGSIDWLRDDKKNIEYSDEASKIKPDQLEIIFGTDYKLQYVDPFLFCAYQFRQWTLKAKLIIAIGYGFGDDHINGILGQALTASTPFERKLLTVAPYQKDETEVKDRLRSILNIERREYIEIKSVPASEFMNDFVLGTLSVKELNKYFPEGEDVFAEIIQD